MKIEILYVHMKNHEWYEELEINFGNEYIFNKVDGEISVKEINKINLFGGNILSFTAIIGNNGVGKSTILRTIFHAINSSNENLTMIIKESNKIYLISGRQGLKLSDDSLESLGLRYGGEKANDTNPIYVGLISHTLDYSLQDFSTNIKKSYKFNFTPTSLISQPENFLGDAVSNNASLLASIRTYYLIDKIHQILFIEGNSFEFFNMRTLPTHVRIEFEEIEFGELFEKIPTEFQEISRNSIKGGDLESIVRWQALAKANFIYNKCLQIIKSERVKEFKENYFELLNEMFSEEITSKKYKELVGKAADTLDKELYKSFIFENEVKIIKKSLEELLPLVKGKKDFVFPLKNAALFLQKELLLLQSIGDFLGNLIPKNIIYLTEEKEFYFSTGEEQMIRLVTYINTIYTSVIKQARDEKETIILLIDEPDNGLNPQSQKKVIYQINKYLQSLEDSFFQIIMTTHSPIIAGDLPSNHLKFLNRSFVSRKIKPIEEKVKIPLTFAENIYLLYKNAFFVKDGLIGDFANTRLMELYRHIRKEEISSFYSSYNTEQIVQLITEISEPLLRLKFEEELFKNQKFKDKVQTLLRETLTDSELKERIRKLLEESKND